MNVDVSATFRVAFLDVTPKAPNHCLISVYIEKYPDTICAWLLRVTKKVGGRALPPRCPSLGRADIPLNAKRQVTVSTPSAAAARPPPKAVGGYAAIFSRLAD